MQNRTFGPCLAGRSGESQPEGPQGGEAGRETGALPSPAGRGGPQVQNRTFGPYLAAINRILTPRGVARVHMHLPRFSSDCLLLCTPLQLTCLSGRLAICLSVSVSVHPPVCTAGTPFFACFTEQIRALASEVLGVFSLGEGGEVCIFLAPQVCGAAAQSAGEGGRHHARGEFRV
jgi:hypothetical protein